MPLFAAIRRAMLFPALAALGLALWPVGVSAQNYMIPVIGAIIGTGQAIQGGAGQAPQARDPVAEEAQPQPRPKRRAAATRPHADGLKEPGQIAERRECGRNGRDCRRAARPAPEAGPKKDLAAERRATASAEADRARREDLKRRQDSAPRTVVQSQKSCPNPFGGPVAQNGEYICSDVGELHACRCTGASCRTIPTGSMQCTLRGAVVQ